MREIALIEPDCCPVLLEAPLSAEEAEDLSAALRVVAEPARLRLLSLIASAPDREACVCDLTEPLGLTQPTVSHHLRVLNDAGLVSRSQRGRWAFYRVDPERLALLQRAFAT